MAQTTQEPLGKVEQMLCDMINGEPIVEAPENRIEGLLMELADAIEQGGGGGDVTGVKGSAESTYRKGNVSISKDNIGLENVDNTSDLNKPVSTAQQTALDGKVDKVAGKGLSTNDYTNTDKELVGTIPTLAPISLVKDTVGWTGKNKGIVDATTTSDGGLTFTVNSNKSVTIGAGTATSNVIFWLSQELKSNLEVNNDYILSGCPAGGGVDGFRLDLRKITTGSDAVGTDYGAGRTITYDATLASADKIGWCIRIGSGTVISSPITFYPMIRNANITDPTYEPYHESVEVMYGEEIHGVNLLENKATTQTNNGVTFTVNSDGSVTANGTATADSTCFIQGSGWNYNNTVENFLKQGETYILSDGVNSYTGDKNVPNIRMYGYTSAGTAWSYGEITANTHKEFTVDATMKLCHISVYIRVPNGQTVNNLVFYPMLRKAEIEDSTYRPYNYQAIQNQLNAQGVLGAKNLLPYPYVDSTKTVDSVTFTDNGDGSVSLSGIASANPEFRITPYIADNRYKGMILTSQGGSSTASGAYVRLRVGDISSSSFIREVVGSEIIIPEMASNEKYYIAIRVTQGTNTSGIRIYPMLRLASDPDDTYVPYAPTNAKLNEEKMSYADNGVLGAKNLIKYPYGQTTREDNGVTYTDNGDGSVTVNGTATANSTFTLQYRQNPSLLNLKVGETYLVTGGKSAQLSIGVSTDRSGSAYYYGYDKGNGLVFSPPAGDVQFGCLIQVTNGSTVNNVTVYPMIRLASDPDDTYQPYAMTNRELTESVASKALNFTLSTENATLLRNDSKIKGDIVSVRVQLQVTSEIASGTELIRKDGTPHAGFGVAVLGETNTGNMYETYIASSSSNLSFIAKNTIPTGYYALNYTYIQ